MNQSSPHRMRVALGIAGLLLLLVTPAAAPAAPGGYAFFYVDAFQSDYGLRESYLFDVNDRGQACGWATDLPGYSGYWWSRETDKARVPLGYPRGINNAGKIAGLDKVVDPASAEIITIPLVPGAVANPVALDINDHDFVVGYAEICFCSNSDRILQIPFVWDPAGGSRSIPVPGAKELVKINNHEVAVGIIRGGSPDGFVHDVRNGTTVRLGATLPPNQYPWTEVADINDLGVATGKHRSGDFSTFDGYVWSAATGSVLLPRLVPNQPLSVLPAAINDAGTVVGSADAGGRAYHAFVWSAAEGIRDLNTLVSGLPAGFVLDRALEINDEGLIVGDGHFGPTWSSSQAFVLIPQDIVSVPAANLGSNVRVVPNPSTGAARFEFFAGAAGRARLAVYDLRGRLVANLAPVDVPAGAAVASWDGRDASGRPAAAGTYIARIEMAGTVTTRKFAIVR